LPISCQYLAKPKFILPFGDIYLIMSKKQIWREVLQMQENNRTEFKRELNDRFERSVVSLLNYPGGGEIIIGIDDNGATVGVADADDNQLKIVDRIRNNVRPQTLGLFDVLQSQIDGKFGSANARGL
jgi:predicted HTH transcriptional regulator